MPAKGVLVNDIPVSNHGLAATLEPGADKGPQHGTVTLNVDGSFTYKPAPGYSGPDSFVYRATDVPPTAEANSQPTYDVAKVSIYVRAPIVANNDIYSTPRDTALSIAKPGVLATITSPRLCLRAFSRTLRQPICRHLPPCWCPDQPMAQAR